MRVMSGADDLPLSDNPYAVTAPLAPPVLQLGMGPDPRLPHPVYRSGKLLVLQRFAQLPVDRCIKSNELGERTLKRKLLWQPQYVLFLLLINIIVYAIVSALVSKRATIVIGLSDYWYRKRLQRLAITWIGILLSIAAIVAGIAAVDHSAPWAPAAILCGFIGLLGFIIYGIYACRLIVATKIDDRFIWIKGAHPDYLDRWPEWPFPN